MTVKKCRIAVEGRPDVWAYPGPLLLGVLDAEGIDLHNDCGGQGKCGKCRVLFLSEPPEPVKGDRRHLSEAELAEGLRLACFHQVIGDCLISIPEPAPMDWMD